ncbi:MAG: SsrA-binding protein SmpB, partial [Lachnospiraceae bacterium]|nr:SsrA-binding protein SmpB [Lachnospiraceae bacterium]
MADKQEFALKANNKKAYFDYFIEQKYETGIELFGTEVKSVRQGKVSIKESFIKIEHGEVIVYGMHISPYEQGNIFNRDPLRPKKLLMHKAEIRKLNADVMQKGYTLVPLQVYIKGR